MANSLHDLWLAFLSRPTKTDQFITGGTGRSAVNDNLLAASGSAAVDTMSVGNGVGDFQSFYVEVVASAGISAGAIIFEGSNDNTNFATMAYVDAAAASASTFSGATVTVAASTFRFFQGPVTFRYFRVRISTAFVGGTVSATARLSTAPYPSGAVSVTQNTAGNLRALVTPLPAGSGGNSMVSASITNSASTVKSSLGQVYGWDFHNPNATIVYVQFFNNAAPTVGTTTPVLSIGIPANGTKTAQWPHGLAFSTAIAMAATTTRTGGTAPGSTVDVNVAYT